MDPLFNLNTYFGHYLFNSESENDQQDINLSANTVETAHPLVQDQDGLFSSNDQKVNRLCDGFSPDDPLFLPIIDNNNWNNSLFNENSSIPVQSYDDSVNGLSMKNSSIYSIPQNINPNYTNPLHNNASFNPQPTTLDPSVSSAFPSFCDSIQATHRDNNIRTYNLPNDSFANNVTMLNAQSATFNEVDNYFQSMQNKRKIGEQANKTYDPIKKPKFVQIQPQPQGLSTLESKRWRNREAARKSREAKKTALTNAEKENIDLKDQLKLATFTINNLQEQLVKAFQDNQYLLKENDKLIKSLQKIQEIAAHLK